MDATPPPPLAVVGASGGVGSSTLALAIGRRLAVHRGSSVVVDLDLARAGLDVTAGAEHLPGHRWEAFRRVRGRVPAEEILVSLPTDDGCRLLSAGGPEPRDTAVVPEGAVLEVLAALRGLRAPVVLDLPGPSPLLTAVAATGARVVLVVALHTRGLADADAAVERLFGAAPDEGRGAEVGLVTRGGRVTPELVDDLVHHLGAPHLHHLPDDPRVRQAAERGIWPGTGRDAVRSCADAVLDGPWAHRAAS